MFVNHQYFTHMWNYELWSQLMVIKVERKRSGLMLCIKFKHRNNVETKEATLFNSALTKEGYLGGWSLSALLPDITVKSRSQDIVDICRNGSETSYFAL